MRLTGTVLPPDKDAIYREIAKAAIDGDKETPKLSAGIELDQEPSSHQALLAGGVRTLEAVEAIVQARAKAVQDTRNALQRIGASMAPPVRFAVKHGDGSKPSGNMAYVSVATKPYRTRTKKVTPPKKTTPKA